MTFSSEYYLFGDLKFLPSNLEKKPELLVVSVLHGDEEGVVVPLFQLLRQSQHILPPYMFVPVMSKLAQQAGTRDNAEGLNFNRAFTLEPAPPEVQTAKDFVRTFGPFPTVLSVHEDNELDGTYVYYEGQPADPRRLEEWRKEVKQQGHRLHTGFDDLDDLALGMWAEDGYIRHAHSENTPQMFESWMVVQALAQQAITLEIPMHVQPEKKYQLLRAALRLVMIGEGESVDLRGIEPLTSSMP